MRWFFNGVTRLVVCISIAFILVTCGDDVAGPDPDPDPPDESISLSGTVAGPDNAGFSAVDQEQNLAADQDSLIGEAEMETDTLASSPAAVTTDVLDGETPLAGADVVIYILDDYAENPAGAVPAATATTNQEGNYEADGIPAEHDLLILVESEPRLSTIVPGSDDDLSGDVNTATTLAAEYYGPDLMAGMALPEQDFLENIDLVSELLEDRLPDELADALVELVPENFGDGFPDPVPSRLQYLLNALSGIDLSVCEDIELAENSARPTNVVDVYGLAEDFGDEPWAWLYDTNAEEPDEEDRHLAYMERTEGEIGELMIPIHPADHMGGGLAVITISDEDEEFTCPAMEFEVEPLQPAPGAFEGIVDEMEELFEQMAERFGQDPDELRTMDLSQFDEEEAFFTIPIAAGLQVIDGPDHTDNLREQLERGDYELLDALIVETGYDESINQIRNVLEEDADDDNAMNLYSTASISSPISCEGLPINVSTPEQLDCWMKQRTTIEDALQQVKDSRSDHDIMNSQLMQPITGDFELADLNILGLESAFQFHYMFWEGLLWALPAELLGLDDIEPSPRVYQHEDDNALGSWTGELWAQGSPWDVDLILLGSVLTAPGGGVGVGTGAKYLQKLRGTTDRVEEITDILTNEIFDLINKDIGLGELELEPLTFGPVFHNPTRLVPDEKNYFDWELRIEETETGKPPIVFTDDERGYLANAVGVSELRVRTKGGDVFLGQDAVNDAFIEVQKIDISITGPEGRTSPFFVEPGQLIVLFAEVENAIDKSIEWEADAGFLSEPRGEFDQEVSYTSPMEQGSYMVRATSTAETGAREDREPPRIGRTTVVVGEFNVLPDPVCLGLEESINFSASLAGEEVPFEQVQHTFIEGTGSLSSDGEFIPTEPGDVTIEFEYHPPQFLDPVEDEVSFTVVDEDVCSFIEVKAGPHHEVSRCVAGHLEQDFNPDWGVGNAWDFAMAFDLVDGVDIGFDENFAIGIATDEQGKLPVEGEWTRRLSTTPETFDREWGTGFIPDIENLDDPFTEVEGWAAPSMGVIVGDPPQPVAVGNQDLIIHRKIMEIDGNEVAVFSGYASGIVWAGNEFNALDPDVETLTGEITFGGVIDITHDPRPPKEVFCEPLREFFEHLPGFEFYPEF